MRTRMRMHAQGRVLGVFANADQGESADVKGVRSKGDSALTLYEFLEFLVRVSFARANPRFGGVGHEHDVRAPLPDCLRFFLHERLLKLAKRDSLRGARRRGPAYSLQPAACSLHRAACGLWPAATRHALTCRRP